SVFALFLEAEHGVTARTIGYFYAFIGGLSLVMRLLFLGPVVDRVGERWAMRLGAMSLPLGMLLYPLAGGLRTLVLVMPLVPIGTALPFPATRPLMWRHADRCVLGTVMGTAQTLAGVARVIAPLAAAAAVQRLGHGAPFWLAALVVFLVSLLASRLRPVAGP